MALPRPAALRVVAVHDGLALGSCKPGHHSGQVVVEGVGVAQPEHLDKSKMLLEDRENLERGRTICFGFA